jgi:hypothetical protein
MAALPIRVYGPKRLSPRRPNLAPDPLQPSAPSPFRVRWLLPPVGTPPQGRREQLHHSQTTGGSGSSSQPLPLVSHPLDPILRYVPWTHYASFLIRWFGCWAGVVGAAFGLLSRHRARLGTARAAATYALNLAIATGCYGGEVSGMEVSGLSAAKFAPVILAESKSVYSWLWCD